MIETHAPGVLLVRYDRTEDMAPGRQASLLEAIRESARAGPVAIVFDVGPGATWVDVSVPTFWLCTTTDASLRIRAMAIVTDSAAVRIAAAGFATACAIRPRGLEVRTFRAREPALAWAGEVLAPRAPVPAAG